MNIPVTIGLYRHFKGAYYYVQGIAREDKLAKAVYFNVLHPEYGIYTREIGDFLTDYDLKQNILIKDREDNVTGQIHRFERVVSLDNEVKNLSTETLINELRKRADSPLQELDIEGLSDRVFCSDYIVGTKMQPTDIYPHKGVSFVSPPFDELAQAQKYFETHKHTQSTGVFKRTFIEIE